jgi:iron complex transport system ATP-binding protein
VAAGDGEVASALRAVGDINPLFAIETMRDDDPGGWRPATALHRGAGAEVAGLVAAIGDWLGTAERRVAASMAVLGYSARLLAPAAATLLRDGLLLNVRPGDVWWRYSPETGFRLCLPAPSGWRLGEDEPPDRLADDWFHDVVDRHLRPFVASVRQAVPVAVGLLWGNVASSLAGALRMLALTGVVSLSAVDATGRALLDRAPLRGAGELVLRGGQVFFVRRSCCLYYRLPGGGLCADCVLLDPAERERQWAQALVARPIWR